MHHVQISTFLYDHHIKIDRMFKFEGRLGAKYYIIGPFLLGHLNKREREGGES
jgi:hypothetical protein